MRIVAGTPDTGVAVLRVCMSSDQDDEGHDHHSDEFAHDDFSCAVVRRESETFH
jgi:hypothetical protein